MFIYKEKFHHSWKDVGKSKSEMKVIYMKESIRVIYELRMHIFFGDTVSVFATSINLLFKGFPFSIDTKAMDNNVYIPPHKKCMFR